ncbi:hypothetical protein QR77_05850 [Streptomyces sp. 150FB]|nr:hypothetical protein QR77_05850 [Streptomyces sp. 150FB]
MEELPAGGPSLRRILDTLGTGVLRVAHAPLGLEAAVTAVTIQDPSEPVRVSAGEILLGVGVERDEQVVALLAAAGARGAAAVVVKHPFQGPGPAHGTALLHLSGAVSWTQITTLLKGLTEADEPWGSGGSGESWESGQAWESGEDLFATADAVSALIDAPLVIEDRSARVLAYSGGQERADEVRTHTILARRDPDEYVELHRRRKVFDQLHASSRPLVLAPMGDERVPRAAVALRAGGEIVGSMWAATARELTEKQLDAYAEAAKVVALRVLRARAVTDLDTRLRDDLLGEILAGGAGATAAGGRLGFPRQHYRLVAAQFAERGAGTEDQLRELAAALRMHLAAVRPHCLVRRMGDTVYAAVPAGTLPADDPLVLLRLLEDFTEHRSRTEPGVRAGLGRRAGTVQELRRSRDDCDTVLRVMRSGQIEARAARADDVRMQALLLRLSDVMAANGEELDGPAAALIAYDAKHRTTLAGTLLTHFAVFGDARAAAARLHVHPNTYRYRLRRVTEVSGLDLKDPDAVLAAVLHLRLHRLVRARD